MAFARPSAAKQTTVTQGTGTLTLIANSGDTRSLQQALGSGPVKGRFMLRGNGYFEMFRGTYTAPSTLTRDETIISSNSNTPVNIPPGTTDVYLLDYAQYLLDKFSTSRTLTNADATNSLIFTGSSAANLTLPASAALLPDFWNFVRNDGTAILTLVPNGADTIDETLLWPGDCAQIYYDTTWRMVRFQRRVPGFIATRTTNLSQTGSTTAKVTYNVTTRNDGGYWASDRFTPPAGVYLVSLSTYTNQGASGETCEAYIYKNGASVRTGPYFSASSVTAGVPSQVCAEIEMNGTDYLEAFNYSPASTAALIGDAQRNFFSAFKIRDL